MFQILGYKHNKMNCIQDCKSLFNNSSVDLLKKNILGDSKNLMCLIYVQFRRLDRMIQVNNIAEQIRYSGRNLFVDGP